MSNWESPLPQQRYSILQSVCEADECAVNAIRHRTLADMVLSEVKKAKEDDATTRALMSTSAYA